MAYSMQELYSPQVILARVSRTAMPGTFLSQIMGWNIGSGPVMGAMMAPGIDDVDVPADVPRGNTMTHEGRTGQYDYFDNVRTVMTASVPGTAATMIKMRPAGTVRFTIPRSAEAIVIDDESATNRRPIGGPSSMYDFGGREYVRRQQIALGQRAGNVVEMQTSAMLRGKYYFVQKGDQFLQSFTNVGGDSIEINYQIPGNHQAQLEMGFGTDAITATWALDTTDIPGHCYVVNARMLETTGLGFSQIVVSSKVWRYVQLNQAVQKLAGTYNPFDQDRSSPGGFSARLKGLDWITWHICDYGLLVYDGTNEVWTPVVPINSAIFLPQINSSWTHYMKGGEWITEGPNGMKSFRRGYYAYAHPLHDPSGTKSYSHLNGFPALTVPKAIAHATVVF